MTEQRPPYPPEPPQPERRPSPLEGLSARRIFDMVKTPITLLVLLALLVFGGWWGMSMFNADRIGPAPVPCSTVDVGPTLKTERVTVKVWNGGTKRGLAKSVSNQLRTAGFFTDTPENTNDRIGVTVVKGHSADSPEVQLVRGFFPGSEFKADPRPDHAVNVYVGNKYQDLKADAPKEVPVTGGKVCLPLIVQPTATPTGP